VFAHLLPNQKDGTISLAEVEAGIRPNDIHQPPTRLLVLENTHNRCGGVALTATYTKDAAALAHKHNMKLHIDGARIFNAAAALGVDAANLTQDADSVTFCLSKGLCAPAGSVLCGDEEFIQKAKRLRKMLGGGMRQAGVLAAAGIIAVEKMSVRLTEDHRRAKTLAEGLAQIPVIHFEMGMPQTNMVFPSLVDDFKFSAADVAKKLADGGIKVGVVGAKKFRMVTHYWIDDAAIEKTVAAVRAALK
jgi:threonine aldolase